MGKAAADPANVQPEADPCRVQPGLSLPAFLLAAATPAGEGPLLDCVIADRNFRMRSILPPRVIAEDEARPDGWVAKFLDSLDTEAGAAFERIDCFPTLIDPLRVPSQFLDHLLYHLGNPFTLEEGLNDTQKRRLAMVLFAIYALKGTCPGMIGAIRVLFDITVTECIQGNIDCWILGESELGVDTILCPSSEAEKRTFQLMVDINLHDTQRAQMTNVVKYMKPANTHFAGFVEPGNDDFVDHWELGLSDLNVNTILH